MSPALAVLLWNSLAPSDAPLAPGTHLHLVDRTPAAVPPVETAPEPEPEERPIGWMIGGGIAGVTPLAVSGMFLGDRLDHDGASASVLGVVGGLLGAAGGVFLGMAAREDSTFPKVFIIALGCLSLLAVAGIAAIVVIGSSLHI